LNNPEPLDVQIPVFVAPVILPFSEIVGLLVHTLTSEPAFTLGGFVNFILIESEASGHP
jgi:hypothetical protein